MNRLYVPTLGPTDWRRLLADPSSQWEPKKSALEMAVCWESARGTPRGLPPEVAAALDTVPELHGATLVLGLPEHKVMIEGGGHASQNDLWALLRTGAQLVSVAVEAKAGEPLDNLVDVWLEKGNDRSRKPHRLAALQKHLGIVDINVGQLRYQLLHRTASALIEAERFRATSAVMLVHSFNRTADQTSWEDYCRFAEALGGIALENRITATNVSTCVPLFLGWITSLPADENRLRTAM